ncbi:MAG: PP2C family protein-serine/threonine phosphatase [Terracidiphilus sp.]
MISSRCLALAVGADGSLLIVVGDVSGKGLKAAMTVSTIVGALRDFPERRAAKVLAHLNRVLCGQITGFATCCVALVEQNGATTVSNAGHVPPYCNGQGVAHRRRAATRAHLRRSLCRIQFRLKA